jgi:hypothetical protein
VGVGDNGGWVNLVGGCSGRPVHGEVAGAAAVRSSVRLPSAIGEGKECVVLVWER